MDTEQLKDLQKQSKKARRIATEYASQLHDLIEDRLPAGYEALPPLAQQTYEACQAWAVAEAAAQAAERALQEGRT